MSTPFIRYHMALGAARFRLGEGVLRIALEAPLMGMRSLLFRLHNQWTQCPIPTEEWPLVLEDLEELHKHDTSRGPLDGVTIARGATITMMQGLLQVLQDAERPGDMNNGGIRDPEREARAVIVEKHLKITDRLLGPPTRGDSFLFFDQTDLWIPRRVTLKRLSKTLAFLQDIETGTVVRAKTRKSSDHGLVPIEESRQWPRNGLQLAMAYGGVTVPA